MIVLFVTITFHWSRAKEKVVSLQPVFEVRALRKPISRKIERIIQCHRVCLWRGISYCSAKSVVIAPQGHLTSAAGARYSDRALHKKVVLSQP